MTIRTSFELILVDCSTLVRQHDSPLTDRRPLRVESNQMVLFGNDGDDDSFVSDCSDGSSIFDVSLHDDDEGSSGAHHDEEEVIALLNAIEGLFVGGGDGLSSSSNHAVQSLLERLEGLSRMENDKSRRQREEDEDSVRLARSRGISAMKVAQDGGDEFGDDDHSDESQEVYMYIIPLRDHIDDGRPSAQGSTQTNKYRQPGRRRHRQNTTNTM